MDNEYYGVPSTPTSDFLAHYGVRGMKWGVRKAVTSGNEKALGRQYKKAAKKLAKLEKRAASGKKYAKRAAALGAGAAAAGGLAVVGASGVGEGVRRAGRLGVKGARALGTAMEATGRGMLDSRKHAKLGEALRKSGHELRTKKADALSIGATDAAQKIQDWARSTSGSDKIRKSIENQFRGKTSGKVTQVASDAAGRLKGVSNQTLTRIGAGVVGAGLAAGAGYNAYRAATTKRAAKKAAQFRSEMNKAFAGTKYANGSSARKSGTKKRRRTSQV